METLINPSNELKTIFEISKAYIKEKSKIINKDIVIKDIEKETTIVEKYSFGVLVGIMVQGELIVGCQYKLGPFSDGSYKPIEVLEVRCNTIKVKHVYQGQYCSIAFKYSNGK